MTPNSVRLRIDMKKISSSLQSRNTEPQSSTIAANSVYSSSIGKINTPRMSARSNNGQSSGSKSGCTASLNEKKGK